MSVLGGALLDRGKIEQAEPLIRNSYVVYKQLPATTIKSVLANSDDTRPAEILERLIQLCQQLKQVQQAADLKKELEQLNQR